MLNFEETAEFKQPIGKFVSECKSLQRSALQTQLTSEIINLGKREGFVLKKVLDRVFKLITKNSISPILQSQLTNTFKRSKSHHETLVLYISPHDTLQHPNDQNTSIHFQRFPSITMPVRRTSFKLRPSSQSAFGSLIASIDLNTLVSMCNRCIQWLCSNPSNICIILLPDHIIPLFVGGLRYILKESSSSYNGCLEYHISTKVLGKLICSIPWLRKRFSLSSWESSLLHDFDCFHTYSESNFIENPAIYLRSLTLLGLPSMDEPRQRFRPMLSIMEGSKLVYSSMQEGMGISWESCPNACLRIGMGKSLKGTFSIRLYHFPKKMSVSKPRQLILELFCHTNIIQLLSNNETYQVPRENIDTSASDIAGLFPSDFQVLIGFSTSATTLTDQNRVFVVKEERKSSIASETVFTAFSPSLRPILSDQEEKAEQTDENIAWQLQEQYLRDSGMPFRQRSSDTEILSMREFLDSISSPASMVQRESMSNLSLPFISRHSVSEFGFGSTAIEIDSLPLIVCEKGSKFVDELCLICRDAFQPSEHLRLLPCLHAFHANCIDAWLARSRQCPTCQNSIDQQSIAFQ